MTSRSIQLASASISQDSRLDPIERFERKAGQVLAFPRRLPLHRFQPEADVVNDRSANRLAGGVFPADQVGQIDDELLEHGMTSKQCGQGLVGHCFSPSLLGPPDPAAFALACGPP